MYPYSHTTRSDGTVLTELVYNGDHQNHVDNQIPQSNDDYENTLAQFQLTTDPAPAGIPSLATSLAGETERLRFSLRQMKQILGGGAASAPQWNSTLSAPSITWFSAGARIEWHAVVSIGGVVPMDTTIYDSGGMANLAQGQITAPVTGFYRFGAHFVSLSNAVTASIRLVNTTGPANDLVAVTLTRPAGKAVTMEAFNKFTAGQSISLVLQQGLLLPAIGNPVVFPALWMSFIGA